MAERFFKKEVQKLYLGEGQEFRGEGILAVTKALLQSGVSYVAGYQGAPISHLMDVLTDANDILMSWASILSTALRKLLPQPPWPHQLIIPCAEPSLLNLRLGPTLRQTRWQTWHQAGSRVAHSSLWGKITAKVPASCRSGRTRSP